MDNRIFKYKFRFFNDELNKEIGEIKYLDVPNNASPSEKYQWYLKDTNNFIKLTFISMTEHFRVFKEGILYLKDNECEFNGIFYRKN